jgi:hypothetical protein
MIKVHKKDLFKIFTGAGFGKAVAWTIGSFPSTVSVGKRLKYVFRPSIETYSSNSAEGGDCCKSPRILSSLPLFDWNLHADGAAPPDCVGTGSCLLSSGKWTTADHLSRANNNSTFSSFFSPKKTSREKITM